MANASNQVLLADNKAYTSGSYLAYAAPWNKGSLVQGVDYFDTISIDSRMFPNSVVITSSWPTAPANGVYGFDAISFGDYDGTTVQKPIASAQIKNIGTLTETHSFSLSGDTSGFDVINDMFLTSGAGSTTTHLDEIEISLHTPAFAVGWIQSLKQVGTFADGGVTWSVAMTTGSQPDILIAPANGADMATGTFDIKQAFGFLVSKGVLTGNEYFNGMALGMETHEGSGTLTINNFSADYQPAAAQAKAVQSVTADAPVLGVALAHDTGASGTDNVTADATLTGVGAANATIVLSEGARTIATVGVGANGTWSYAPTALADGAHTVVATETDRSGATATASLAFTLETKATALTAALKNDTGASATDRTTSDPTLTGKSGANAAVTLMNGSAVVGTTVADAAGNWTYKPVGLADGYNQITVKQTDAAGNTSSASVGFVLDTKPQAITIALGHDTGASATDRLTYDPVMFGMTTPGALVTFSEGGKTLGTAVTGANGTWVYTPTGLANGTHTITASEVDLAGNVGSAALAFTLDTQTPYTTVALKNGAGAASRLTSDPTLTGKGGANSVISFAEGAAKLGSTVADANGNWTFKPVGLANGSHQIAVTDTGLNGLASTTSFALTLDTQVLSVSGGLKNDTGVSHTDYNTSDATLTGKANAKAVLTFSEGTTKLGSTVADASGGWTFAPAGLADGFHQITATETDAYGMTASTTMGFTLDTKAPGVTLKLLNDTGLSASDNVTGDARLVGGGTGNAVVTFTEGGKVVGTTLSNATGAWSFTPTGPADGTHTIVATQSDIAGNVGTASLTFALATKSTVIGTQADTYNATAGHALTIGASSGVLANDIDPNRLSLGAALAANGGPSHGTLALSPDGSFAYTASAGYVGPDRFTYVASDSLAHSAATTVTLNVAAPTNHAA